MIKALASKRLNGRVVVALEGNRDYDNPVELIDKGRRVKAKLICKDSGFSFAVLRNGGDGGRG